MNSENFYRYYPKDKFGVPYQTGEEYLADLMGKLEFSLELYLSCVETGGNQALDRFKGIVVTESQVKGRFSPEDRFAEMRQSWQFQMGKADFFISSRLEPAVQQGLFFAPVYLKEVFRLSELQLFGLLLALMPEYDKRYGAVFAFLQDDVNQVLPDADLTVRLFNFSQNFKSIPGAHRMREEWRRKAVLAFYRPDSLRLDRRIADFLLQNGETSLEHRSISVHLPENGGKLPVMEEQAKELARILSSDSSDAPFYLCLKGAHGSGRLTLAQRAAELLEVPAVIFHCGDASDQRREDFIASIYTAGRESVLLQGLIILRDFQCLLEEPAVAENALQILGRFAGTVIVLTTEDAVTANMASDKQWIELPIQPMTKTESAYFWEDSLKGIPFTEPPKGWELANKFIFLPEQIVRTAAIARIQGGKEPVTPRQLTEAAYQQVSHKLKEHATLIHAKHTWEQLVLADTEKEMLQNACNQVRYQHIVYEQWGFHKRLAYGKGISMLFAGPPGTGKTMAAQVIGNDLGIEIYKVDLSQVVSKYIGETEKNLNQVFNEAKKSNVILLFDETDAILGKRTEVKDSHDKNANMETAFLLQKMEEYDGITIMTTNYKENIDSAFFRRISYVIHFSLPEVGARKAIWKGIFPEETPLMPDVDFDYLASQFSLSGGSIKNIAVVGAFLAAQNGESISMRHLVKAIRYEMVKQGKIMLKEDFGEYGYLLERS